MKKKELRNLAKQIAKYELIIQNSGDAKEIAKAQDEIMKISNHVGLFDIDQLDEYVQEFLKEKN